MTRNVLDRFLQGRQPYNPVTNAPGVRMRELFNCPLESTEGKLVPGWRGDERDLTFSARCSMEGPTGLELAGDPRIRIVRNFAPTGNAADRAELVFWINAGALSGPAGNAIVNLLTLQARRNNIPVRAARVELDAAGKRVRLTLFDPSSAAFATTAWLALDSAWNELTVNWRSPGTASLRVGTGQPHALQNPFSGQTVSELQVTYEQPTVTGHLCVDNLHVAVR